MQVATFQENMKAIQSTLQQNTKQAMGLVYEHIALIKGCIVALYIALLIYPLSDNDNTLCSIWSQQPAGAFLSRSLRALIAFLLLAGHLYHLLKNSDIVRPRVFTFCAVSLGIIMWDRLLSDHRIFPWYHLDRLMGGGEVGKHALLHDIVSIFALIALALLPITLQQKGNQVLDFTPKMRSIVLGIMVVLYIGLFMLFPGPDDNTPEEEKVYKFRDVWWVNVFQIVLVAFAVGLH